MHKVASAVAEATDATFIHIADPTAAEIRKHGIRTVRLLGTRLLFDTARLHAMAAVAEAVRS